MSEIAISVEPDDYCGWRVRVGTEIVTSFPEKQEAEDEAQWFRRHIDVAVHEAFVAQLNRERREAKR